MEKNVYKVWANCCRAVKPMDEQTLAMLNNIAAQPTHKRFFSKKRKPSVPEKPSPQVSVTKPIQSVYQPLDKNFDMQSYLLSAAGRMDEAQMQIITLAVKTGIDDSYIKQMIDSGQDAQHLKQVLEALLARRVAEQHNNIIGEEEIFYE